MVFGGLDTHRDTHVGALVDTAGRLLGSAQFRSDPAGYPQLVAWMQSRGQVARVGWKEPAATAPAAPGISSEPRSKSL